MTAISAHDVHCPACYSHPGEQCTQPDNHGRHPVTRMHYAREEQARWLSTDPGPFQDITGDIWEKGEDGLMHSFETAPFTLAHVEKKWGPLTPVAPDDLKALRAKERDAQVCRLCGEVRRLHTENGECPGYYTGDDDGH